MELSKAQKQPTWKQTRNNIYSTLQQTVKNPTINSINKYISNAKRKANNAATPRENMYAELPPKLPPPRSTMPPLVFTKTTNPSEEYKNTISQLLLSTFKYKENSPEYNKHMKEMVVLLDEDPSIKVNKKTIQDHIESFKNPEILGIRNERESAFHEAMASLGRPHEEPPPPIPPKQTHIIMKNNYISQYQDLTGIEKVPADIIQYFEKGARIDYVTKDGINKKLAIILSNGTIIKIPIKNGSKA